MGKRFSLVFFEKEDGSIQCEGANTGFSAFEVIGLLDWKRKDIYEQMAGNIAPDHITRTVIHEE